MRSNKVYMPQKPIGDNPTRKAEIIVYLDDYKYSGDGKYDIMYLDFRTTSDFEKYVHGVGIKESTRGSYLEIMGYRSPRRLMQGCYYALNIDMLKQLAPQAHPESLLISQTYDFYNYHGRNDDDFRLLQAHGLLEATELKVSYHNQITDIDELKYDWNNSFRVNDVSQANWNEIIHDEEVKLVYDLGAPVNASKAEVRFFIDKYAARYSESHPCLVLSHWDKDHYHCLLEMTDAEIKNFSKFICVDKIQTATARKVFYRIEGIMGKARIFCIAPPAKKAGRSKYIMKEKFVNNTVSVYVGLNSRNINYCGLILYADGDEGNVVLSGDCTPTQANHVLIQEMAKKNYPSCNHYLVVPHHGGEFKAKNQKVYHIPRGLKPISAIISVDAANNTYGHPKREMLNWLNSVAPWKIERTDLAGTIKYDL